LRFCIPLVSIIATSSTAAFADLYDALPDGRIKINWVEMTPSPMLAQMTLKIQAAARKDPVWFKEHAMKSKPGGPLLYDPKLGLTRAEYDTMMTMSNDFKMHLVVDTHVEVIRDPAKPHIIKIDGGAGVPELTGLEFDTSTNLLKTKYGTINALPKPNDKLAKQFHLEAAKQWSLVEGFSADPKTIPKDATELHVLLGTRAASAGPFTIYRAQPRAIGTLQAAAPISTTDNAILYYDLLKVVNGRPMQAMRIVTFTAAK